MSIWKTAFLAGLDPDDESEGAFEFGPPATADDLAKLQQFISAKIPEDVCGLLLEFNGVKRVTTYGPEPYYFSTHEMPTAVDMYRSWDVPTDLLIDCSRDILYLCQENGFSQMWGVTIRPFGPFIYGQIVAFDHDRIDGARRPEELFLSPYPRLADLLADSWKILDYID